MPRADAELGDLPILREIGVSLRAAAAVEDVADRGPRWWRRGGRLWRSLRIVGPVAIVVAAVVSSGLGRLGLGAGRAKVDVAASASAALAPRGEVIHLVLCGGPVRSDGTPLAANVRVGGRTIARIGRRIEQWSAGGPLRFRVDTEVTRRDGRPWGDSEYGLAADGSTWTADAWRGTVRIERSPHLSTIAEPLLQLGSDAEGSVKALLDGGRFVQQGAAAIEGRRAIELVAEIPASDDRGATEAAGTQVRYFVDAKSFVPLRVQTYRRRSASPAASARSAAGAYALVRQLDVERYERIPLADVPADLFVPPSPSGRKGRR